MKYNVAQIRKSKNIEDHYYEINGTLGSEALNSVYTVNDGLSPDYNYYLYFKVNSFDSSRKLVIELINSTTNENYIVKVVSFTENEYQIVFQPFIEYDKIVISTADEDLMIDIANIHLYIVNNALSSKNIKSATVLGIQADPSFLVAIDGEGIRIGESGFYKVPEGIYVHYIGAIPTSGSFLIDYKYRE